MYELEDEPLGRTAFIVMLLVAILFIGGFVWVLIATDKVECDQKKFLGACIEFHSIDRCK